MIEGSFINWIICFFTLARVRYSCFFHFYVSGESVQSTLNGLFNVSVSIRVIFIDTWQKFINNYYNPIDRVNEVRFTSYT